MQKIDDQFRFNSRRGWYFRHALCFIAVFSMHQSVAAQSKVRVDGGRPLRIDYKANSWNKNPKQIENAIIIIRDANSGSLARVELTETGPNTAIFQGIYQLNFKTESGHVASPEIYIVPQKLLKNGEQLNQVEVLIKNGTLIRKPFFLRSASRLGTQLMSVYDDRKQAYDAYEDYLKVGDKTLVDHGTFEAEEQARLDRETKKLAEQARLAELEKQKLEFAEKLRQEELKRKQAALDSAERARRKAQAKIIAEEAMQLYQKDQYAQAEEKFNQAIELDPSTDQYLFQYAVTLYQNNKNTQSLATLNLVQGGQANETEKLYYMGLNHMKLKDFDSALKEFNEVKNKNDKGLSPSASFFCGIMSFQKEDYDVAKTYFEYVLDTSSDAKMDEQAETYIEQIANAKQFLENKKRRWTLGLNGGLTYDSNILNLSTPNSPSDLAGFRAAYGASIERRLIYERSYEWSALLTVNDLYSTDNNLAAKANFQNTDPLSASFTLPFKYRGIFFKKPTQTTLTPGYETINLNADASGARELIASSYYFKSDQTYVMTEDWFSTYSLDLRKDNSALTTTEIENQSATKITLMTMNMFFQDKKKTEAIIAELGAALNLAEGDNQKFNKYDLAGTYMHPLPKDIVGTARLGMSYTDYTKHDVGRKDTLWMLSLGARKNLTEKIAGTFTATFMDNQSTLESSKYNKYSLMAGASWSGAF